MPYVRDRTCEKCGKVEIVRKDNSSSRCQPCAASERGKKTAAIRKAEAKRAECPNCGDPCNRARAKFCSVSCKSAFAWVARDCRECGVGFQVLASALKTNASGNFCGRACYEKWMCRTDRITGRGSQWKKSRAAAIKAAPFCAICGTNKKLQVHHIVPFRLTFDNSPSNLIPLCIKHHKWVEMMFVATEAEGSDPMAGVIWGNILRSRQQTTAAHLKELLCAAA